MIYRATADHPYPVFTSAQDSNERDGSLSARDVLRKGSPSGAGTVQGGPPLTCMETALRKPVIIAAIIASVSMATLLLVNHTNLIIDRRPPQTPPGTTFNTANGAGATVAPTMPDSEIKPKPAGPEPIQPAIPAK
jgi:hypothetical protein